MIIDREPDHPSRVSPRDPTPAAGPHSVGPPAQAPQVPGQPGERPRRT